MAVLPLIGGGLRTRWICALLLCLCSGAQLSGARGKPHTAARRRTGTTATAASGGEGPWTGMLAINLGPESMIMVYKKPSVQSTPRCFVPGAGYLRGVPDGSDDGNGSNIGGKQHIDKDGSIWQRVFLPLATAHQAYLAAGANSRANADVSNLGWALMRHADGVVYLRNADATMPPYIANAGECFDDAAIQVDAATGEYYLVQAGAQQAQQQQQWQQQVRLYNGKLPY